MYYACKIYVCVDGKRIMNSDSLRVNPLLSYNDTYSHTDLQQNIAISSSHQLVSHYKQQKRSTPGLGLSSLKSI